MTQARGFSPADDDGTFELAGIPSIGRTQIWATVGNQEYGAIFVEGPTAAEPVTIRIGEGLNGETVSQPSLIVGQRVPSLRVISLDGEATTWQPESDRDRLVVIGALWHPSTQALIKKARAWCKDNQQPLQVISLDWSLKQAQRESKRLQVADATVYAGPGTLQLPESWLQTTQRAAIQIANNGTVTAHPLD